MIVADFSLPGLHNQLATQGLAVSVGPFKCQIKSTLANVSQHIHLLYADAVIDAEAEFADFPIEINRSKGLRGWLKPQATFTFNGTVPFTPLPLNQAAALLEWGINWCVSAHAHQYLIFHAAVVEKNDRAIIMPAPSGSGKSTLCAGLVSRGWRLLSDELTLLATDDGRVHGFAKPISLKNASIAIIKDFWPQAVCGKMCKDTQKGTVAHLKPPAGSMACSKVPVSPAFVIFPKYAASSAGELTPKEKGQAFMALVENAFNYHLLGAAGFRVLQTVMDEVEVFDFEYSDLEQAVNVFESLVR